MPSAFAHATAALSLGACAYKPEIPRRVWAIGAVLSAVPDLDVIGFRFGIPYGDVLGHRGITHSFAFAALLAAAAAWGTFRREPPAMGRRALFLYFFLATASHGLLDALTNGGLGIAFFAPFWNERYFFPVTPIQVSPIGVGAFLSERSLSILQSEALWVGLPSALLAGIAVAARRIARRRCPEDAAESNP